MSKSMQVPILVFETKEEVEILMKALHNEKDVGVNKIYETTNNS